MHDPKRRESQVASLSSAEGYELEPPRLPSLPVTLRKPFDLIEHYLPNIRCTLIFDRIADVILVAVHQNRPLRDNAACPPRAGPQERPDPDRPAVSAGLPWFGHLRNVGSLYRVRRQPPIF
jgi:hypothetical protein